MKLSALYACQSTSCVRLLRREKILYKRYERRVFSTGHEPLRILFCGSDAFSATSLRALREKQLERPGLISSLDVVCRPGKRTGRGLKKLKEVPIRQVAQELQLPVHEIDTFTGWTSPSPVDLIIAVSFGLFVPRRLLEGAKHGGLNLHPSLLPDFRGAAPLHHTLLSGRRETGITLQTLDPHKFDNGHILAQIPSFDKAGEDGEAREIKIPNSGSCTVKELEDFLAPIGAKLLVQGLEDGLFRKRQDVSEPQGDIDHPRAPKITKEDRHIQWNDWTAQDILRRQRVLGSLWGVVQGAQRGTRVILHDVNLASVSPDVSREYGSGTLFLEEETMLPDSPRARVLVRTSDSQYLVIGQVTVESQSRGSAAQALHKAHLLPARLG